MTKFTLPKLPYALDALEPIISKEIMDLHYNKHHAAYCNNLNAALEKYAAAEKALDIETMIALQSAIKFNGGGFINHSIFWETLAPAGKGGSPSPKLKAAIERDFGSLDAMIKEMSEKTGAIQGSGWGWLGAKPNGTLEIVTCQNQDPLITLGLHPLFGIDVWEHAYYLQYKNVRPDYIKAIWEIVNWDAVSSRYK